MNLNFSFELDNYSQAHHFALDLRDTPDLDKALDAQFSNFKTSLIFYLRQSRPDIVYKDSPININALHELKK